MIGLAMAVLGKGTGGTTFYDSRVEAAQSPERARARAGRPPSPTPSSETTPGWVHDDREYGAWRVAR